MKRLCLSYLVNWKNDSERKPLLVRGARQVGKTYSIREFGKTFSNMVEINFELMPEYQKIFATDLDPVRIIRDISLISSQKIIPGKTLVFFDEIQRVPEAISALRYFYELMPTLHVVAAGSLLEFVLESVGVPVGRITMMHMYPCSFAEFLVACGDGGLLNEILYHDYRIPISEVVHQHLLRKVGEYLVVGGMPAAIRNWQKHHDLKRCSMEQSDIIEAYRVDFERYAKKHQRKHVDLVFDAVPAQIGKKFVYTSVADHVRKREMAPAFELLEKAGVVHRVTYSTGQGIPLGAGADPERFKPLFLDIAIAESLLGLDVRAFLLDPETALVNKGALVEAFVGQELLALHAPFRRHQLHYWCREARGSTAEVDYLMEIDGSVVPVEVKSGTAGRMRSIRQFLAERAHTPYALRFSTDNYSDNGNIRSYPLYAVAALANSDPAAMSYLAA